MSADIIASSKEYLTNGVGGSLHKGTNKLAMRIKDAKTLVLLTDAAVQAGTTEGREFRLLQNDTDTLLAVSLQEDVSSTVVLNKSNGLAVWLNGKREFFGYGAPSGSVDYMACR